MAAATARAQSTPDAGPGDAPAAPVEGTPADAAPVPAGPTCVELSERVRRKPPPPPQVLFDYAACRERAGDTSEAIARYHQASVAAKQAGDDALRRRAFKRYASLVETRAPMVVNRHRVPMDAWVAYSLDGEPLSLRRLDSSIWLDVGEHRFVASRPGCGEWSHEFTAVSGEPVNLNVPPLRCHGEPVPPTEGPDEDVPPARDPGDDDDGDRCYGCYITVVAAVVFAVMVAKFRPEGEQSPSATGDGGGFSIGIGVRF